MRCIRADGDATILVLTGEPIDEPIVGYGPFVMNSEAEIRQAIDDYNSGRFAKARPDRGPGSLPPTSRGAGSSLPSMN
jgi:hypothetical protein